MTIDIRYRLHRRAVRGGAFTMVEALIAAVVFAILSLTILAFDDDPNADVSAAATELAGWLDNVQRRAQLVAGQSCTVTFLNTDERVIRAGASLARATPSGCSQGDALIPSSLNATVRYLHRQVLGDPSITFTPRGTVTASQDTELRLRRADASVIRCVRISAILGIVSIGSATNSAPSATTSCSEDSYTSDFP